MEKLGLTKVATHIIYGYYNTVRPDPYGLASVEIVRGPASVLYGQGTTGGLVALTSKRPQQESAHELRAEYGSWERRQFAFDTTGPISDTLSYRLVALQRDSGTQVDYVPDDRWVLAPALSWQPADWLRWTLLGNFQEDHTGSSAAFLPWEGSIYPSQNPNNGRIPTSRFTSEPGFDLYEGKQNAGTSLLEIKLGNGVALRQNLRWSDSAVDYRALYPNVYVPPQMPYFFDPLQRQSVLRISQIADKDTEALTTDHQLQIDWRLWNTEHTTLVGIDYSRVQMDELSGDLTQNIFDVLQQGLFNLYEPEYGNYIAPATTQQPQTILSQLGWYLQDQIKIARRIILVLGARRDEATTDTDGAEEVEDAETSLRAGLLYKFDAGFSPYLSYSESFEAVAGYGAPDENNLREPFKPRRGKQLEGGLKYQPPGGAALLTFAAFKTEEEGRLATDAENPAYQAQLGKADIRGYEFEGTGTLFDALDLIVNYTWLDGHSSNDDGTPDKYLPAVAEQTAALWAHWRFALGDIQGFSLGAGVRHQAGMSDETGDIQLPDVTLFDAMAAYDHGAWRLAINGTNLEDETVIASCGERGDCFYGARRNVVGSIAYRF